MKEYSESNQELARAYREQILRVLLEELYCHSEPMSRTDRYDKTRIKRMALEYLAGAGVELPKSGEHANTIERTLREIDPETRHEIPGAVMAIVVSEGMFRTCSVLERDEKEALYARTFRALSHVEREQHRGGWTRFCDEVRYRSILLLTHEFNDPAMSEETKEEYCDLYEACFGLHGFEGTRNAVQMSGDKQQKKDTLVRRFGMHLLGGLASLAFMGGPQVLGPEHRVDEDQISNDDDENPEDWPYRWD